MGEANFYYFTCLNQFDNLILLNHKKKHLKMAFFGRIINNAKPRWALFKTYAKAELAPPLSGPELLGVARAAGDLGMSVVKGRFLLNTTKTAAVNVLIGAEIAMWFYVGEVIGRGSLIGYNV